MAYRCSKFINAYCLLSWREKKKRLKKIWLHIFDDVGVAACDFLFFLMGWTLDWTLVACAEDEILTTTPWRFRTNADAVKLKINMSLRVLGWARCSTRVHKLLFNVFSHVVILDRSSTDTNVLLAYFCILLNYFNQGKKKNHHDTWCIFMTETVTVCRMW